MSYISVTRMAVGWLMLTGSTKSTGEAETKEIKSKGKHKKREKKKKKRNWKEKPKQDKRKEKVRTKAEDVKSMNLWG
jgi:phage tail tape-measure protein